MKISTTAVQNGFGSDPWKTVNRMLPVERAAGRAGEVVYFMSEPCNDSPTGWRVAICSGGRFAPRCPRNVGLPLEPPTEAEGLAVVAAREARDAEAIRQQAERVARWSAEMVGH